MQSRRHLPALSRALIAVAAGIATIGVANCAAYVSGARDGMLSGSLAAATRSSAPARSLTEILTSGTDTYIGRLLADRDSTVERWPDHVAQPLRVWIDSGANISGEVRFPAAVREAFSQWSLTGIPLRFTFVNRPNDADVKVHWTDHLDHKTGSTTWRTDRGGWLTSSDITLATHISSGSPLDARGMRAIALHEVGHALGLSHSGDAHDIMAPLVRVDGLSETDRNTIRLLYTLPAGPVR
jgi:hypothetical protein